MPERVTKRKAGRPPLAPSNNAQVTLRRERDRLAQRTSRQRKASALAQKDERIDKLSRTIDSLTSLFTDFNELVFKSRVVQADLNVAKGLKHLADRFLTVATDAAREENGDDDDDESTDALTALLPSSNSSSSNNFNTPVFTSVLVPRSDAILSAPRPRSANSDGTYTLTYPPPDRPCSPRLTYGFLTDQAIDYPSSSIVTTLPVCLRVPTDTFGWRLLKTSFLSAYPLFVSIDHSVPLSSRLRNIFQHTIRHEPLEETCSFLLKVIEYYFLLWGNPLTERTKNMALDSREFKSMESTVLALRKSKVILAMLIKRDCYLRGEDLNDYMHAWAVERYLDTAWGLDLTSTTVSLKPSFWTSVRPYQHHPEPPPPSFGADPGASMDFEASMEDDYAPFDEEYGAAVPSPDNASLPYNRASDVFYATGVNHVSADNLICNIKNIGVCFGNGPRFPRQKVDEAVSRFLSSEGLVAEFPLQGPFEFDTSVGPDMASVVAPV